MRDSQHSRTAIAVAAVRAAHLKYAGGVLFADPVARVFLSGTWSLVLRHRILYQLVDRLLLAKLKPVQTQNLLRARYCEERLGARLGPGGVRQYVILSAGLDSFAWRQPPAAAGIRIFEIDHPASQRYKLGRIRAAGLAAPANLTFVAVDFSRERWREQLLRAGFDPELPTFWSWMGSTYYLPRPVILDTFRDIRAGMPPGSEFVCDFGLDAASVDPATRREQEALARFAARRGEPFLASFSLAEMRGILGDLGFGVHRLLTPEEIAARYLRGADPRLSLFSVFLSAET